MPMHDWKRVEPGIYHHFHHEWISEISRTLNRGLLPPELYAMAEQQAAGFGPDVPTLQDVTRPGSGRTATLAAYDCGPAMRADVETIAAGEAVPDVALFLEPEGHILVPLEATYQAAWDTVPARWQRVIAAPE